MRLDGGWVDVGLGLHELLWWQLIHLFVHLLRLWVDDSLLGESLLLDSKSISFLPDLSFLDEGLLELGWLWVELIIILPLLLKNEFLIVGSEESSKEGEELELSQETVATGLGGEADLRDLSNLACSWHNEEHQNIILVLGEGLSLKKILILEGLLGGIEKLEIFKILVGVCHFIK